MMAGSKAMRLMQLADLFHLPLISLADEPGFMVGPDAERQGIERAGARMVSIICSTRMPWLTIVLGKLYGVAGQCHHRPSGMFRRYAWPSANWGSMHITGGVAAAPGAGTAAPGGRRDRTMLKKASRFLYRLNSQVVSILTAPRVGASVDFGVRMTS